MSGLLSRHKGGCEKILMLMKLMLKIKNLRQNDVQGTSCKLYRVHIKERLVDPALILC